MLTLGATSRSQGLLLKYLPRLSLWVLPPPNRISFKSYGPVGLKQWLPTATMAGSPPPTPPPRQPTDEERRFVPISLPCEWIESYYPGGYHPVHLGDTFKNGRYEIIRKLGDGSFSTVWLARDTEKKTYVALKILVSDLSESTDELQMLLHIYQAAPVQAARFITQLWDNFEHTGPNGLHQCLVFEPMGPTVNSMVEELPQPNPLPDGIPSRYPPRLARTILKQSLQALVFLHKYGIAHGDFQPGNMLFTLDDINSKTEDSLRQEESVESESISPPVERLDGKTDRWAPRYLCVGQPLAAFANYTGDNAKIKLSDMGGAYFFADPPKRPVIPTGLRAPELVLTGTVNKTFDVWSFGCLLFEIITGLPLFCTPWSDSQAAVDDNHLLQMTERLGPLPDELYKHWKTSLQYFTPQRELYNCGLGGVREGEEPLMFEQKSMEVAFDEAQPELEEEEARAIKMLIRRILQYDPAKRPSAAEVLQDPWFGMACFEI
ncbi:putative serine protein kinase [Xylaria palmicola]|nr:putative serine protein kinase [Xylaria palmicola]